MILVKYILRNGATVFSEVSSIDASHFAPNDSLHLIFNGRCNITSGRPQTVARVPARDIASITLYSSCKDGTIKVSSYELSDLLGMLLCKLRCDIFISNLGRGEKELQSMLA